MSKPHRLHGPAILFAIVFPTLVTFMYFVMLADQPAGFQQSAYSVGKVIQFAFPVVFALFVLREKINRPRWNQRGMKLGLGFGLLVAVAMMALYHLWLKPAGFMDGPGDAIREKVQGLGLNSPVKYGALSVFYALCHSFMEEYYWRWFVFRQLRTRYPMVASTVLSSVGFMAHHVVLLGTFFGYDSPMTYLFSVGVAVGGAMWAWIYEQGRTLYSPWLSHLLVDAAIFLVGYDLVKDQLH